MIEQKLQDKIEDVAAAALQDELSSTEAPEALAPEAAPVPPTMTEDPVTPVLTEDPNNMQIAGITSGLKGIMKGFDERVIEAEQRGAPKLPDVPVQEINGQLVIQEVEQEQLQAINEAFGGEYDKSLNFPAIMAATGEFDAAEYMARFRDANADFIESARRGTVTIDQALEYAMNREIGPIIQSWLKRNPGQPANVEDFVSGVVALDGIVSYTDSILKRLDEIDAMPDMTPELQTERDQLLQHFRHMITVQGQVAINVSAAVSEGARLPAASGALQRQGLPDAVRRSADVATLMQSPAYQDVEFLRKAYGTLHTKDARLRFTNKLMEGAAWTYDVLTSLWMNSMLSSFPTHVINMAGNASLQGLDILETYVAAGISKARRSGAAMMGKTVDPNDMVYGSQATQKMVGIYKSFMDSFYLAMNTFITEQPYDMATKLDMSRRRQIGTTGDMREIVKQIRNGEVGPATVNFLGSFLRLPGRALLAEDEFFKGIAMRGSIYEQAENAAQSAKQQALDSGATIERANEIAIQTRAQILENPPTNIQLTAQEAAAQMTLTNELKGVFRNLQTFFSFPILKQFMPFVTAPLNEYSQTLNRVPILNFASSQFRSDFMAGGARRDKALAKMFTASGIAGMTVSMVGSGFGEGEKVVITGAGPKEYKARKAFERQGFQPYSFNILQENGMYKSIPYGRLGPVSGVLAMAADFSYYSQYEQDYSKLEALAHAMTLSAGEYLIEMPYLQNLKEIMSAVRSPEVEQVLPAVLDKLMESQGNFLLSTIPGNSAFGRSLIRMEDTTMYSTLIPAEGPFGEIPQEMPSWTHPWYEALQKQAASNWIFNQREGLYPQLNIWGEERTAGTPGIHQFYSPWRVKEAKWKPLDTELVKLGRGLPEFPRKYQGVTLTDQQMHRWITLTNTIDSKRRLPGYSTYDESNTLKPRLARLIVTPSYKEMTDRDRRVGEINKRFSKYKSLAWDQMMIEFPELKKLVDESKKPTPVPKTLAP